MPELAHDYCSPSKLDLRYHCPGSVRLEKALVGTGKAIEGSAEATEGTLKHAQTTAHRMDEPPPADLTDDVLWVIERTKELVEQYKDVPDVIFLDEYQIDLSDLGISGGTEGCRIDLLIVIPGRKAVIVDYKYGVGWVARPHYNWQMKGYGVGVFRNFGVTEIEVIILQPNVDEEYQVKVGTFQKDDAVLFQAQIKAIVEYTLEPDAPLVRGTHCSHGFCRAKGVCPLWRDAYLELPVHTTVAAHMQCIAPERRQEIYENLLAAESWCKKARATIEAMAINDGLEINGWEIGTGRKTRAWAWGDKEVETALTRLMDDLKMGFPIYTIVSPSEVEKILGKSKKVKVVVQPMVIYKEGKPCLKKKGEEW